MDFTTAVSSVVGTGYGLYDHSCFCGRDMVWVVRIQFSLWQGQGTGCTTVVSKYQHLYGFMNFVL